MIWRTLDCNRTVGGAVLIVPYYKYCSQNVGTLQGHLNLAVRSTHIRAGSGRWALKLEQSLRELTPRHDKLEKELKVCLGLAVT